MAHTAGGHNRYIAAWYFALESNFASKKIPCKFRGNILVQGDFHPLGIVFMLAFGTQFYLLFEN
jgi:hypothetical protein